MPHSFKHFVPVLSVLALSSLGVASAASYIDLSPRTSLNYGVNTSIKSDTSVDTGSGIEVRTNGDTKTEVDNETKTDRENKDKSNGTEQGEDSRAEVDDQTSLEEGQFLNVNRAQVSTSSRASDNASVTGEARSAVIVGPGNVRTYGDLRSYSENAIRGDENMDEVNFTNRSVDMTYTQEGRLFALLSVPLKVRISAKADGTVTVRYPWYSILTVDNKQEIEAKLKVAVDNTLRSGAVGSVAAEGKAEKPTLSPSELATLVARIQEVLKTSFSADATATGTSSVPGV